VELVELSSESGGSSMTLSSIRSGITTTRKSSCMDMFRLLAT